MSSIQGNSIVYALTEQASPSSGVPATPVWSILTRTSGDIDITKSFTQSEAVDPTRQSGYNIITGSEVAGSIDSELSVGDPMFKTIVAAGLQNSVAGTIQSTGSTTFTNGTAEVSQVGAFATAVVGQYFGSYDTVSNNRVFRIVSITDNDTVVVSPAPVDETISATLSGDSIRNSNVEAGLAFQKRIPTDANTIYKTFEGCQIGGFTLSVSTESIVTLSYDVLGLGKVAGDTQIAGSTDNPVDGSRVSGTVKDVLEFWLDGVPVSPDETCFTDFTIALDNGSQGNPAIGKEGACSISFGAANITGSLVSYVDGTNETTANSEVLKRDNETLFQLGVTFKDVDNNYLVVSLPSAQYTELTQADTSNGDILQNTGTYGATGKPEGYAVEFNFITAP